MKLQLLLFSLLFALSCDKNDGGDFFNQAQLVGTWLDDFKASEFRLDSLGNLTDTVIADNITYHIKSNGTYSVDNRWLIDVPLDGKWTYDPLLNKLTFLPEPVNYLDTIFLMNTEYSWQIISLDDQRMEVEARSKGGSIVVNGVLQTHDQTMSRKFSKLN